MRDGRDMNTGWFTRRDDGSRGRWTWSWTNWTFGVWWYTTSIKKIKLFGLDLGPLEYVRRRPNRRD